MHSSVLQVLQDDKAVALAAALDTSEATIHRLRENHLPMFCALLAHVGLKIVPVDNVTVNPDTYRSVCHIATKAMARPDIAEQLVLEDE